MLCAEALRSGVGAISCMQCTWWVLSTAPPRLTSSNSCLAARLPTSSGTAASSPCRKEPYSSSWTMTVVQHPADLGPCPQPSHFKCSVLKYAMRASYHGVGGDGGLC